MMKQLLDMVENELRRKTRYGKTSYGKTRHGKTRYLKTRCGKTLYE